MRDPESGGFVSEEPAAWQVFMSEHECVSEWSETRPLGTQKQYGRKLMRFCEQTGLSPEQVLALDSSRAHNEVWKFVRPFIRESSSKAKNNPAALKSFYRSKDGEISPLDSRPGWQIISTLRSERKQP